MVNGPSFSPPFGSLTREEEVDLWMFCDVIVRLVVGQPGLVWPAVGFLSPLLK